MKRYNTLVFCLLAFLLVVVVIATLPTEAKAATVSSGTCGDNLTWTLDDEGTLTISGTGAMTDYYDSYSVPWDNSRSSIKKVVINSGVTSICDYAFKYCTGLTSVTIPDSVTSIGYEAFRNCTGLTSITIPDSVTSIGWGAFLGCTNLSYNTYDNGKYLGNSNNPYVVIMDTVSSKITDCTIHEDTKIIGYEAFRNCTGLTSVTIGEGVTSIGEYAFRGCSGLTSITIPDSVTSIGGSAFSGCTGLVKINFNATAMNDLSSLNYVFECAGWSGNGITVNIGANVTKIPAYLFYPGGYHNSYAPEITTVNFAEGSVCNSIGEYAFFYCTSLTSVTIGEGVTSIGDFAFDGCTGLEEINFNATAMKDLFSSNYVFYQAGQSGNGITVNIGANVTKIPAYLFCPYISSSYAPKITTVNFAEGSACKSIGTYAFENCAGLTSITIPNSVTSIGSSAFYKCTGLTSITIPDSVTSIGSSAFSGCSGLSSVTIPDSVTSIGGSAFYGCTGLEEINFNATVMNDLSNHNYMFYKAGKSGSGITVNIGANVTKIPAHLFNPNYDSSYAPKITTVSFAEGSACKSVGKYAFYGCTGLTSITIGDSVTSIGSYAFEYCTGLTSITIPDSVTSIGDIAFCGCTSLTSITIGDSVTSIGYGAFNSCTGLEEINFNATAMNDLSSSDCVFYKAGQSGSGITVNIGANVTKIPAYLFYPNSSSSYAPKITTVNFAEGSACTSIGDSAFYNCTSLTSITIPDSVTSIGDSAFYNCTGLTNVTIGEGLTSIDKFAIDVCLNLKNVYYAGSQAQWNAIAIESGNSYLFNANIHFSGVESNGWRLQDGKWYYYVNGVKKTGWLQEGSAWYYLKADGAMATGWVSVGGTWYYMKSSGAMATGWIKDGSSWYYLKSSGAMATGWRQEGSTWYYLQSSGAMATGTITIGNQQHKFNGSGVWLGQVQQIAQNGWVQDGGSWYYYKNGTKLTGWQLIGSTWYFLKADGKMATGWLLYGGDWYYLQASGAMTTTSVVYGGKTYNFNASGVCLNP